MIDKIVKVDYPKWGAGGREFKSHGLDQNNQTATADFSSSGIWQFAGTHRVANVAPPLAGAFGLRVTRFALYFGAGSALGAFVPLALGVAFHAQLEELVAWLGAFGGYALAGIAAVIMVYAAYRWLVRRRVAQNEIASE